MSDIVEGIGNNPNAAGRFKFDFSREKIDSQYVFEWGTELKRLLHHVVLHPDLWRFEREVNGTSEFCDAAGRTVDLVENEKQLGFFREGVDSKATLVAAMEKRLNSRRELAWQFLTSSKWQCNLPKVSNFIESVSGVEGLLRLRELGRIAGLHAADFGFELTYVPHFFPVRVARHENLCILADWLILSSGIKSESPVKDPMAENIENALAAMRRGERATVILLEMAKHNIKEVVSKKSQQEILNLIDRSLCVNNYKRPFQKLTMLGLIQKGENDGFYLTACGKQVAAKFKSVES